MHKAVRERKKCNWYTASELGESLKGICVRGVQISTGENGKRLSVGKMCGELWQ